MNRYARSRSAVGRLNAGTEPRWRSVTGTSMGVVAAVALVTLPIAWFSRISSTSWNACTTPTSGMAHALDARMRSPRVHVDQVRVVEVHDPSYENLFVVSARVRASGTFVGIGTWASNFSDLSQPGDRFDWSREPDYVSLTPVNDLARTVSTAHGVGRSPGMTQAAKYSQNCVYSATSNSKLAARVNGPTGLGS